MGSLGCGTHVKQIPHGALLGVVGLTRVPGSRPDALVLELEEVLPFHLEHRQPKPTTTVKKSKKIARVCACNGFSLLSSPAVARQRRHHQRWRRSTETKYYSYESSPQKKLFLSSIACLAEHLSLPRPFLFAQVANQTLSRTAVIYRFVTVQRLNAHVEPQPNNEPETAQQLPGPPALTSYFYTNRGVRTNRRRTIHRGGRG